ERVRPAVPTGWRGCPDDSWHRAQPGCDVLRVATLLDEDVERLHHAGTDSGDSELVASGDRCPGAGEVLQLRFVRVQLRPEAREDPDDHQSDCSDRERTAEHEARPTSPGAVFGMAAGDEPLRHHGNAVAPGTEHGQ